MFKRSWTVLNWLSLDELDIVTHELELKEDKVAALVRELEGVQLGAGGGD